MQHYRQLSSKQLHHVLLAILHDMKGNYVVLQKACGKKLSTSYRASNAI